jgi:CRP-like cAMP-binding protein
LCDLRIFALSRGDFLTLLGGSPNLCLAVITELTKRLRHVDEQASSLSFQGVKERTVGLLKRLAKHECEAEGRMSTQPLTHQQIADMIGTSRETVTRAIKGLKTSGWLEQDGKRYLVPSDD